MKINIEKIEIRCTVNLPQSGEADIVEELGILGEQIMATVQQVKAAVIAEAAEVKSRIDDLEAQVQALKDGVGNGVVVTEAELDEILVAVQSIFTPAPPPGTGTDTGTDTSSSDINGNIFDANGNMVDAAGNLRYALGTFTRGDSVTASTDSAGNVILP